MAKNFEGMKGNTKMKFREEILFKKCVVCYVAIQMLKIKKRQRYNKTI